MNKFAKKVYPALLSVIALSSLALAKPNSTHASNINQLNRVTRTAKKNHKATNKRLGKAVILPKKQHNTNIKKQAKQQLRPKLAKKVHKSARRQLRRSHHKRRNWYADGLSKSEQRARNWVSTHESGNHWNILSYGGRCVGRFQLDPGYLGRKNGHINLNHKHQVRVADAYVARRYGGWIQAKHFWQSHHWY